MINPTTLDEAIIEAHRFVKAAKALRAAQKTEEAISQGHVPFYSRPYNKEHAATLRASMDLTRKLADLRQGR